MTEPIRIVTLFRPIVAKVSANLLAQLQAVNPAIKGVQYKYGHYTDIKQELIQEGKLVLNKERYPLIVLFEDFKTAEDTLGLWGTAKLKFMILYTSKKDYTREQRENLVFVPVLEPVYQEFLKQVKRSGKFMMYGKPKPERIDRPHWGDPGLYKNEGYLFNDVLDGIEINIELKIYLPNCVAAPAESA